MRCWVIVTQVAYYILLFFLSILLTQTILVFVYIAFSLFLIPLQMIQKRRREKEGPILRKKKM